MNFVKIGIFKMWILWINCGLLPQCAYPQKTSFSSNIKMSIGESIFSFMCRKHFRPKNGRDFYGHWACINGLATSPAHTHFLGKIFSVKQHKWKSLYYWLVSSQSLEAVKRSKFLNIFSLVYTLCHVLRAADL